MKKIFGFLMIISMVIFSGCEEDIDLYDGPTLVHFMETGGTFTVMDEPNQTFDISVGVTVVSSNDRTFTVEVQPEGTTAQSGVEYTLESTTFTIPANEYFGTITVNGIYEGATSDGSTLKLKLSGEEAAGFSNVFTLNIFQFCTFDINDFVGTWSGTDSWGYPTEVVTTLVNGQLVINGIGFGWFQDWWGEVIITNTPLVMNVDPVTATFTIAEQPYLTSTYNGAPQPAYGLSGSGSFEVCSKGMTINYVYHQSGGTFDGSSWGASFKEVIFVN